VPEYARLYFQHTVALVFVAELILARQDPYGKGGATAPPATMGGPDGRILNMMLGATGGGRRRHKRHV